MVLQSDYLGWDLAVASETRGSCLSRCSRSVLSLPAARMSTDGGFGPASSSDAQQSLQSFWPRVMEEIRNLTVVSGLVALLFLQNWQQKTPVTSGSEINLSVNGFLLLVGSSWLLMRCKVAWKSWLIIIQPGLWLLATTGWTRDINWTQLIHSVAGCNSHPFSSLWTKREHKVDSNVNVQNTTLSLFPPS